MTENNDVMRASVVPWNVARSSSVGDSEEDARLEGSTGRCRVVDSSDDSSRIRIFVLAWSSVYGRAYEIVPGLSCEPLCDELGLTALLVGAGDTPS